MTKPQDLTFNEMVYEVVKCIPLGKVTSYGAIASYLGAKRSSRMVGWAMNQCQYNSEQVPAHRVVNRNGVLTGKLHFGLSDEMAKLLIDEGIPVKDDQISDFDSFFWDPSLELSLE